MISSNKNNSNLIEILSFPNYVYHELSPVVGSLSYIKLCLKEGDMSTALPILEKSLSQLSELHHYTGTQCRKESIKKN